ncbi:TrkA family potassium uptake protein [bacterium 1XD42-94]|nr:TrkA family potassium uptake protein [bacterium 1XD42-76]NBK05186.1 TrkA family potassium uptake protein [bacterium 1XD42-94]
MKSVLIIGLGRFGRHMAMKLIESGNDVMAVESSVERADELAPVIRNLQIGDAANEDFLRSLGVGNFDLCVVAVGENFQAALVITVFLKDLGAKYVVARATRDIYKKLLLRNGADHVVYAEREVAERLAVRFGTSSSIFDYVELTPEYGIYEISLPEGWEGHTILEKEVRSKYHVSILAIKKNEVLFPMPHPDYVFTEGENLMVMGDHKAIKALVR